MPIFRASGDDLVQLAPVPFELEKELQRFAERNLQALLGIRFIATEFSTGEKHGGRIDTLGLDEVGNPVIIEYKWGKSESVVSQGLYYLAWLVDHKGDFTLAAHKALGSDIIVSWSSPRVVIIASAYTKWDAFGAGQQANVELLRYQRYPDGIFLLDAAVEPAALAAQKPAAPTPPSGLTTGEEYGLSYHEARTTEPLWEVFLAIRERILALDGVTERANQKSQITYRTAKSFAAFDFAKSHVRCQFKGGDHIVDPDHRAKDIRTYGWGYQWSCELRQANDVEPVFRLVSSAYELER